ncbi:MAG: hypothetical protein ABI175_23400 [Polyangiales bacterium]
MARATARPPVPNARWFVARAFDGLAPKLALVDAVLATMVAVVLASAWRALTGPRGSFEELVPMLGTGLRWSVALPIAWSALGAIADDRSSGLLDLARRRGVSSRQWLLGRAIGAGTLVALAVGAPMITLSLVTAGFGGGAEGVLARASMVFPSIFMALATGAVFGLGSVVVGAVASSRPMAVAVLLSLAALGALVDLAVPGVLGVAAHQLVSPFLALEDLQGAVFDAPHMKVRGIAACAAIVAFVLSGLFVAIRTFEHERAQARAEGSA